MATFVLIHGSWHGAWAWNKLVPLLEEDGHRSIASDLPGRGSNPAPRQQQTMANYVKTVVDTIDRAAEPVYLVGHSAGGPVISLAGERQPESIHALIYVAAFMLADGQSVLDIAGNDPGNEILPNSQMIEDNQAMTVTKDGARHALYADCSEEDANWAADNLVAEATEPTAAAVSLTDRRYGSIPRFYIECVEDRALSIAVQRQMIQSQPPEKIFSLATSHSPMLSQPRALARMLSEVVGHVSAKG